jgi:hypothetical protein
VQAGGVSVSEEVLEGVAPTGTEADSEATPGRQMGSEAVEHRPSGRGVEEGHHVPGADHDVEHEVDAQRGQIQFGKVGDQPDRSGMIELGGGDQLGVEVHADDLVADRRQPSTDPAGPTTRVEDPRTARRQGVDEARLAVEVLAGGRHGAKTFDVPGRVARVLLDHL